LHELAESNDPFLKITAEKEGSEVISVFGGTCDAEAFGRVFLVIRMDPTGLEFEVGNDAVERKGGLAFLEFCSARSGLVATS
jgi:hypothetical protein